MLRTSSIVRMLFVAAMLSASEVHAAPDVPVGTWVFDASVALPSGQLVPVRGRFSLQAGGTMVLTDDGAAVSGLPESTLAALAQRGVRLGHGAALGSWSYARGVFTFRVTRFVYDSQDVLGRAIGIQTIGGRGGFDARTATWTFTEGWPVKWEGPDFDASKNEVLIESLEIAHEGFRPSP